MTQYEMRQKLIDSAIFVASSEGFHKTTTKAISVHSGINEAYIYRFFNDKEDLYEKTFAQLDVEVATNIMNSMSVMNLQGVDIYNKCNMLFAACWRFLLSDRHKCSYFIKYYYSHYYNTYPKEHRKIVYANVVDCFATAFIDGTDVWWQFNAILDVVFSNIVKILRDEIPNNEETAKKVFDLVYSVTKPHLTWHNEEESLQQAKN